MLSGGFRTVSALRPAFPLHATRAKVRLFDFTSVSLITDTIDVSSSVSLIADTADTIDVSSSVSLDALGRDLFTFLAASVIVVPISKQLGITPVLGFLALGCAIGPYGLELFSDSEADIELGDFGIVFLLFIEGLNLSSDRVQKLGSFFQLGLAQFLFSIGAFFFSTLLIGPQLLPAVEAFIPLDDTLLRPILSSPVEAFCIASAGALSSSAFVLPVLKQKGWEERADGTAALAILLLQDIAVAPLLVILPLVAGSGPQGGLELGILVAKGTFGFGAVLAAGSVVLRQIFSVVAATRSSETFVAAALLVAVGMGWAADALGLSTTTGAFAAGVLLAGSQYRAQIEADIKPFEGILLGVFFMTAGANLDPGLCLQEWPTLLTGIVAFIGVKAAIIFAAGEFALGLTRAESVRIGLLLAGGGEFAFVIFKLSEGAHTPRTPHAAPHPQHRTPPIAAGRHWWCCCLHAHAQTSASCPISSRSSSPRASSSRCHSLQSSARLPPPLAMPSTTPTSRPPPTRAPMASLTPSMSTPTVVSRWPSSVATSWAGERPPPFRTHRLRTSSRDST